MDSPRMVWPQSVAEAVRELRRRGAVALAGGTDVIPAMRRGELRPQVLVNLKGVGELRGIRRVRGGVRVGALTRVAELLEDETIARHFPLLVAVAREFGSIQIRNLATLGGNLCHAAPSADLALPLLALDATVEIAGADGTREIPISSFFRGVHRTALKKDEVLVAVTLPRAPARTGTARAKLGIRRAMDLSIVGVAVALTLAAGGRRCRRARVALGAVAPVPMRAQHAEAMLEGAEITHALIEQAAEAAAAETRPISDLRAGADYRRKMTRVLVRRALTEAWQEARGGRQ